MQSNVFSKMDWEEIWRLYYMEYFVVNPAMEKFIRKCQKKDEKQKVLYALQNGCYKDEKVKDTYEYYMQISPRGLKILDEVDGEKVDLDYYKDMMVHWIQEENWERYADVLYAFAHHNMTTIDYENLFIEIAKEFSEKTITMLRYRWRNQICVVCRDVILALIAFGIYLVESEENMERRSIYVIPND